jgi:hypothetical protein
MSVASPPPVSGSAARSVLTTKHPEAMASSTAMQEGLGEGIRVGQDGCLGQGLGQLGMGD